MTKEELDAIPRKTAAQLLVEIPGGPGYDGRMLLAIEQALNLEWWRGYHAVDRSLLRPATKATAPDITTPEGRKKARENADYHRDVLKPFA